MSNEDSIEGGRLGKDIREYKEESFDALNHKLKKLARMYGGTLKNDEDGRVFISLPRAKVVRRPS